jgi:hypothetical protein
MRGQRPAERLFLIFKGKEKTSEEEESSQPGHAFHPSCIDGTSSLG